MITVIGDVHGKYERYHRIIRQNDKFPHTVQLGDFGFNYDTLKNVDPKHHVFIGGNHDNYDKIDSVPNYLGNFGHIVDFYGVDFFFYRGAYSIDRIYRTVGIDWWEKEQNNIEAFMTARELYSSIKPDIVLTHDCPSDIAAQMLKPGDRIFENNTSWALQEFLNIHQPKLWLFGHWHKSRTIQYGRTKFVCLNELEIYTID